MNAEEVKALLRKAEERLAASKELFESGHYAFAISSAYYAMFYCARALLISKGITPKSHAGVHAQLGKECVKTGEMPARLYTGYSKALNMRHTADYDAFVEYTGRDAREILEYAEEFLTFTKSYLEGKNDAD
ncbi:HEPN domain-containing protein [Thermococcus sp. Bubb.Bath]|uniref:HEPN domain-containing protein n=1 Tax=Thermococcus sp. Bubb.Bath TaxID=1638242 RepID=UPI00143BF035|nr:HEPN domain-containing protein [Thermococcus sp. Bubb.Bath]NJF24576.1 HEPN domain-containing protein [Thermococcus sp. Bubb.Bath]